MATIVRLLKGRNEHWVVFGDMHRSTAHFDDGTCVDIQRKQELLHDVWLVVGIDMLHDRLPFDGMGTHEISVSQAWPDTRLRGARPPSANAFAARNRPTAVSRSAPRPLPELTRKPHNRLPS